jgi:hypothetical protein
MAEQSNLRARKALVAQASRVKHDERALPSSVREQLNPSLATRAYEEEMEPEEVTTPILERTRLPKEIQFAWVQVGGVDADEEIATVEVGPAGLDAEANFGLINQQGDVFVVKWDPVAGRTSFYEETPE